MTMKTKGVLAYLLLSFGLAQSLSLPQSQR